MTQAKYSLMGLVFMWIGLIGCDTTQKLNLTGSWSMHRVIQDGEDVTSEHNPFGERSFTLHTDSSFTSEGRPYGKNTGVYTWDPQTGILFLDSDTGPEDDSSWNVTVRNDTMYWQGRGTAWAERFRIIHVRRR